MASVRVGAYPLFSLRSAPTLHVASSGEAGDESLEDRARISATQRGTGTRSLRRPQLARMAPPCHPGHDRLRFPGGGNVAQQKKLLGGPCRGHAVSCSTSFAPGRALVATAASRQGDAGIRRYLT